MTVREIAKLAGTSPATVSRFFTGAENVSPDIRNKILAVLGEDADSPIVQKRKTGVIAVIVPHLRLAYYRELMCLFLEISPEFNMHPVFVPADSDSLNSIKSELLRLRPDGMVLLDEKTKLPVRDLGEKLKIPTVLCGEISSSSNRTIAVHVNDSLAAYEGTQYLLSLGHHQIVFFSDNRLGVDASYQRLSGCRKAMSEAGLPIDDRYIQYGHLRYESGYLLAEKIVKENLPFTAVFAFSDEMAQGAVNALSDSGIRVPEDVSVMGFDDLPLAESMRPRLTTIHQPLGQFIREILTYFSSPADYGKEKEVLLQHRLIVRDSCRAINGKG